MFANMIAHGCTVDQTCANLEVSRKTYYRWLDTDIDFAADVYNTRERQLDEVQQRLWSSQESRTRGVFKKWGCGVLNPPLNHFFHAREIFWSVGEGKPELSEPY